MGTIKNNSFESFYLIASDKFDDEIHIFNSHNINFHDAVKRSVQPESLKIFDFIFESNGIQMLSLNDGEFMLDRIQVEAKDFDKLFQVSQKTQVPNKS